MPGTSANVAKQDGEEAGNKRCMITAIPCVKPIEPAEWEGKRARKR